jgi:phosphatidylserine decarboxylase
MPTTAQLINGPLFSVNPIALYKNFLILQENKRMITLINSDKFGQVSYIEIGATNVGSIHQTYKANSPLHKGDEKGYFSFGGSCVVLLFEKGKIQLDHDLCENTLKGFETKTFMGQSLGSI